MPARIVAAVYLLVLSAGSATASGGHALEVETSVTHGRWLYDTWLGADRVEQTYLPVDLLWRPLEMVRVRVGADAAWSARKGRGPDSRLNGPGDFRASVETSLLNGRVRLAGGGAAAMRSSALDPGELLVADALDALALEMPMARPAHGGRWGLQAAALLVQTPFALLHGGCGVEGRQPHRFGGDDREVDPGAVVRVGLGVVAGRSSAVHTLDLHLDLPRRSAVEGGGEFEPGRQMRAVCSSGLEVGVHRIRTEIGFTGREGGTVEAGTPLDASAIRGGNMLRVGAALTRPVRAWELEAGLGGVWVRGFQGALGRAAWAEPSLGLSRSVGSGRMAAGVRLIRGSCREDRSLKGLGLSLGWKGALIP